MVSRLIKGAALVAATASLSTVAFAQFGSGTDFTAPAQSFGSGTNFVAPAPVQSFGSGTNFVAPAPVQSFGSDTNFVAPAPVQSFGSSTNFVAPAPAPVQSFGSATNFVAPAAPVHSFSSAPSFMPTTTTSHSFSSVTSSPSFSSSSVTNTFAGVASPDYADAKYGTGSISETYEGADVEIFGFSGSTSTAPGLAANESLRATNCPTSVYNPDGGRVLGCYDVVAPAAPAPVAQQSYYRVVRPVIYVRYPVYVPVAQRPVLRKPVCNPNVKPAWTSRYGANGFNAPKANNCGW